MTGPEADLTGWACEPFSAAGFTHDVYRKGSGPGVVLIPEMPGVHPGVLALGNYLVDNGFTVVIPSLYGTPGAPAVRAGMVPVLLRGCVAKEFAALATNRERPVANYLRALARETNATTPGKGVGCHWAVLLRWLRAGCRGGRQRPGPGAQPAVGTPGIDVETEARSGCFGAGDEGHREARRRGGPLRAGPSIQR